MGVTQVHAHTTSKPQRTEDRDPQRDISQQKQRLRDSEIQRKRQRKDRAEEGGAVLPS